MDGEFEQFERRIAAAVGGEGAPGALRAAVLRDMRRELRAGRWDRWMGRAAAALVMLGVGLNGAIGWRVDPRAEPGAESRASQESLVATAAAVAEATDAETGRLVARQMAALGGWELTDEEAAAIDAAAAGTRQGFVVQSSGAKG